MCRVHHLDVMRTRAREYPFLRNETMNRSTSTEARQLASFSAQRMVMKWVPGRVEPRPSRLPIAIRLPEASITKSIFSYYELKSVRGGWSSTHRQITFFRV